MVSELCFDKFREILTTGSLEIGQFLQNQSIFPVTAHALHFTGFFRYMQRKSGELLGSLGRYRF